MVIGGRGGHCVGQAGAVLADHLQLLLLRSVLSKMQGVKTATVMQSLLMVYAYLLQNKVITQFGQLQRTVPQLSPQHSLRPWSHSCVRFQTLTASLL